MTQFTPVYGFPWPEETDSPDGSAQIHAGLLAVENELVADLAPLKTTAAATRLATVFTSSGTLAAGAYPNAKYLRIDGCNGGAGGGGAATNASGSSAGGPACGGASAIRTIAVAGLVFPLQVNVGPGGAGGAAGANNGTVGSPSSVITNNGAGTVIWTPGTQSANQKGGGGTSQTTVGESGITPGFDGSTSASTADVTIPGQQPTGVPARYSATTITRPFGGGSNYGAGGAAGNNTDGGPGTGFGGGGGGGYSNNATARAGGTGTSGIVIITPIY